MEQEIISNDELLNKEDKVEILDNSKNNLYPLQTENKDDNLIENLEDSFQGFTPVESEGIKEEILDFDVDLESSNNNLPSNEMKELVEDNDNILDDNLTDIQEQDEIENIITEENSDQNIKGDNEDFTHLEPAEELEKQDQNDSYEVEIVDNNVVNSINESKDIQDNTINNENSLLEKYGENVTNKKYVCNPAIGRDNEIKQLILTLLTPEKSGILVGKPGIGKTAIVEGLGYQIQKGNVPDALKGYQIYKLNTSSLLGTMLGTEEAKIQVLLNEVRDKQKLILFIDEIHTLIGTGAEGDSSLDFANIFKPGLDRGNIKIIGATTSDEYDRYILTDKAFVRRFQKIEVLEPTKEHTVKILMGSLPKLEYKTGAKLKYTPFVQEKIMTFIVDLTTEYRRVYELSARYPDVALTILQQAFSYAVFDNKKEVGIRDVRKAIKNTKLVYPDVIKKELIRFNDVFSDIYLMETPQRLKGEVSI